MTLLAGVIYMLIGTFTVTVNIRWGATRDNPDSTVDFAVRIFLDWIWAILELHACFIGNGRSGRWTEMRRSGPFSHMS